MTSAPSWLYDEFDQVGVDFAEAATVADYDRKQGTSAEADRALAQRLGIGDGQRIIEFGCGTGSFVCEAAKLGAEVDAVDVSRAMLNHAEARAERAGLDCIRFHHAGFLTYRHGSAAVDLIFTRYALHHLPDFWKTVALTRLAEFLKPGGRLYLEDVVFSFAAHDWEAGLDGWIARMADPTGQGFSRADFETHAREEHSTFTWILEAMLCRAGFEPVEADTDDEAYASYLCRRRAWPER